MKNLFKKIIFWVIQLEAKLVLKKYNPRVIAVTGSVGKTSAKEAIFIGLSSVLYIGKSQKSYNSEIGVPLAILGVESGWGSLWKWVKVIFEGLALIFLPNIYPKWLVIEAGVDHPGDMDLIKNLIKSDAVVFTKFAKTPVHVEFFNSSEDVMREKIKLIKSLKEEGVLILNADDEDVLKIKKDSGKHAVTFGFNDVANVKASNLEIFYKNDRVAGIDFKINVDGKSLPVILEGVLGKQHVYPILSAIALGKAFNLNIVKIVEAFKNYTPLPGRMRILDGIFGSAIIDDTYNSSPIAVKKALEVLKEVRAERKIAVLGDMMELGKHTESEHKIVGEMILDTADVLVTVGKKAKGVAESAKEKGFDESNTYIFRNSTETGEFLKDFIKGKDIVLVKGSQSTRLEKTVEKILARPSDARWLLVRQEKEWDNK